MTPILVVWSGFVGRYFLIQVAKAIRARESELAMLRLGLDAQPAKSEPSKGDTNTGLSRWRFLFAPTDDLDPVDLADTRQRAEALADTEYAVRAERAVSRLFGAWRTIHIGTSTLLYALLLLHIWSGYYFGFRWL